MRKLSSTIAGIAGGLIGLSATVPGNAGIDYTILGVAEGYDQTATGTTFDFSDAFITAATATPSDFTSITVTPPGASTPLSVPLTSTPEADGTYYDGLFLGFFTGANAAASLATLNAAYPLGTYTFNATNSVTGASQTVTLDYDANHLPTVPGSSATAVPALTAASYSALQGINSSLPLTLNFNNFTGDGVPPAGDVDPYTQVDISNASTGALVYVSPVGSLPSSSTSLVLPANTLQPGTNYNYTVDFTNDDFCGGSLSCGTGNPNGYVLIFSTATTGSFTTLAAAPTGTTTLAEIGGPPGNPTVLQEGHIGQVDGSIGGDGAQDFYLFYWQGGTFTADAELYGANASGQYEFELLNNLGMVLDEVTLDSGDDFEADLSYSLGAGADYEIGLVADSPFDPNYSITFDTPVQGVPEPGTFGLIGAAAVAFALAGKRRPKARRC